MSKGPVCHEIPIPREILDKSPFEVLTNPPKWPLIRGEEERQILAKITDLTEERRIPWKRQPHSAGGWYYEANFRGLKLEFIPSNDPPLTIGEGINRVDLFTLLGKDLFEGLENQIELARTYKNILSSSQKRTPWDEIWDILSD